MVRCDELTIFGNEHSIVFTLTAVIIDAFRFRRNVTEDNRNIVCKAADMVAETDAFIDIIGLIPDVTNQVPGYGKLRKDNKLAVLFFGLCNHGFHGLGIVARVAGMHVELSQCYFQHMTNLLNKCRNQITLIVTYFTHECTIRFSEGGRMCSCLFRFNGIGHFFVACKT